jgi:ParB-like chromosome segregation protein Spo0J
MKDIELKIVDIEISKIEPYINNAKKHPIEQIEQIQASIQEFGNCDPIALWENKDGVYEIVEGHGRFLALCNLGADKVPAFFLNHLTDEQRRAYTHVHNKLTLNSDFDVEKLLSDIASIDSIDFSDYGFVVDDIDWDNVDDLSEYKEPIKKEIQCPKCGHIDSAERFVAQ